MAVLAGKRVHDNLAQEVLLAGTLGTGARLLSLHLHLHQRNLHPVMKISLFLFISLSWFFISEAAIFPGLNLY